MKQTIEGVVDSNELSFIISSHYCTLCLNCYCMCCSKLLNCKLIGLRLFIKMRFNCNPQGHYSDPSTRSHTDGLLHPFAPSTGIPQKPHRATQQKGRH